MNDSHREEIAKLEALYASNPEGRVFTHLAEAYRKAGQLDRARSILDSGLQRHPDYASAHVVLGRVLSDAGDQAGSAHEFRRVLELDRHNLVALRSLGDLAASGDHAEEALYYYGELAILDPNDMVLQEEIRRFRERAARSEASQAPPALAAQEPRGVETPAVTEPVSADTYRADEETEPAPQAAEAGGETLTVEQQAERGLDLGEPQAVRLEGLEVPEATDWPGSEPVHFVDEISFADVVVEGMDEIEPARDEEPVPGTALDETAGTDATVEVMAAHAGSELAGHEPPAEAADVTGEAANEESVEPRDDSEWHGAEGRWQPPAALAADDDAERERETREDTGEWIPSDRWKWVAASAGEELPAPSPEPDETAEAEPEAEPEYEAPPDWLGAEPEAGVVRDEAGEGVVEAEELGRTLEGEFGEPLARPVDSFEEGAADVLAASGLLEPHDAGMEVVEEYVVESVDYAATPEVADAEAADRYGEADDSSDLVITETLAEIYASQGLIDRAVSVYRRLVREHPEDDRLQVRLSELERSMGPAVEEDVRAGAAFEAEPEPAIEREPESVFEPGSEMVFEVEVETGFDDEFEAESEATAGEEREAWLARVESAFTGGQGAAGAEDSPYAWPSEARPEDAHGLRIGDYFRSLLDWRPERPQAIAEAPPPVADVAAAGGFSDWTGTGSESEEPAPGSAESDEDLEMFRSWLKSLKK